MDILRNLLSIFTSGVMRLIVAAGILLLCYLFIVKPVLQTTNDAIKSSGLDQIGKTLDDVSVGVQREIRQSFKATKKKGVNPHKLVRCIKRARGDVQQIQRCTRKF